MPSEVVFDFGGVDGVSEVVSGAVGDKCDLFFDFFDGLVCEFGDSGADAVDDIEICALGIAADVIGFANFAFGHDFEDSFGMVANKEPVANVCAFSVDGEGFASKAVEGHDGNQFFGELIWAVVVATVGDFCGEAVGVLPCSDHVVAGRF